MSSQGAIYLRLLPWHYNYIQHQSNIVYFLELRIIIIFFYTKRLLVEAYKSYYRYNTNVLNDLVMLKQSSHCLRKSMNIEFPSPKSEIGRLTFRHRAAIAWNSLPDSIKKSSSLECFKKRLRSSKDLINSISYIRIFLFILS